MRAAAAADGFERFPNIVKTVWSVRMFKATERALWNPQTNITVPSDVNRCRYQHGAARGSRLIRALKSVFSGIGSALKPFRIFRPATALPKGRAGRSISGHKA